MLTEDEKKILEEDRVHKEETARLREEDYQLLLRDRHPARHVLLCRPTPQTEAGVARRRTRATPNKLLILLGNILRVYPIFTSVGGRPA